MAKILVIRLSALGDVAMLVPSVASLAAQYPQDRIFVMTRQAFAPLFQSLSFNVNVIPIDVNGKHKGFFGLMKLVGKCFGVGITHVADTHDVLRTKVIRWSLFLRGKKVKHIDKERELKKYIINTKDVSQPLKHSIDRYLAVFEKLGFPTEMTFENILDFVPRTENLEVLTGLKSENVKWIGIAPFARHQGKIYPLEKMEKVVKILSNQENTKLYLFGAGRSETHILEEWANRYPNTVNLAGKLTLDRELILMGGMDLMVSMDSANMHLASLVNTPVVSIWGATHPAFGFYGFRQDPENAIQVEGLSCRPCSVFGDAPCSRGDYACLNQIDEEKVVAQINKVLGR